MSTTTVSNGAVFGAGSSDVVLFDAAPRFESSDDELQPPRASQAALAADAARNDRRVSSVTLSTLFLSALFGPIPATSGARPDDREPLRESRAEGTRALEPDRILGNLGGSCFIESGGVDRDCDLGRERSIRSGMVPPFHLAASELNRGGSVLPSDGGRGDLAVAIA